MSKIELENAIFLRARILGAQICAQGGGLNCAMPDLELQTLLYVYNANFRDENYKNFCTEQEPLESRRAYLNQRSYEATNAICLQPKELNFELLLSEESYEENSKI